MLRSKTLAPFCLTPLAVGLLVVSACRGPSPTTAGGTLILLASQGEIRELLDAPAGTSLDDARPVPVEALEGMLLTGPSGLHYAAEGGGVIALDCKPGLCTPDPELTVVKPPGEDDTLRDDPGTYRETEWVCAGTCPEVRRIEDEEEPWVELPALCTVTCWEKGRGRRDSP